MNTNDFHGDRYAFLSLIRSSRCWTIDARN